MPKWLKIKISVICLKWGLYTDILPIGQTYYRPDRVLVLSVKYAGKNVLSASKTSGVLRVGAFGANRVYVLAHCELQYIKKIESIRFWPHWNYLTCHTKRGGGMANIWCDFWKLGIQTTFWGCGWQSTHHVKMEKKCT